MYLELAFSLFSCHSQPMPQPTPYQPDYDFSDFQALNPTTPLPADKVDIELQAISISMTETQANLGLIQRDDGQLRNQSVGNDQLKADVSVGVNAAESWQTARAYTPRTLVYRNNSVYICEIAHTSGVFATDLAAGRWSVFINTGQFVDAAAASAAAAAAAGGLWCGLANGTRNALAVTDGGTATANTAGRRVVFIAASTNSASATLAYSSAPAAGLRKNTRTGKAALQENDIIEGNTYQAVFDGTHWVLQTTINELVVNHVSAFSPLASPALLGWWNFADYSSLTFVSGNRVSVANDLSGYGHTATQVGGARPTWGPTAFNGVAYGASCATPGNLIVADAVTNRNIFSVGGSVVGCTQHTSSGANNAILSKTSNTATVPDGYKLLFYGTTNLTLRFFRAMTTTNGVWDIAGFTEGVPVVWELYYDDGNPTAAPVVWINGCVMPVVEVAAPVGTPVSDSGADIVLGNGENGGFEPFLGVISSLGIYQGGVSAAYSVARRSYLASLGGMETALVSLLAGQSNMVGNAFVDTTIYQNTEGGNTDTRVWDGYSFPQLSVGTNNRGLSAGQFGPELSFGAAQSSATRNPAYLLKYAAGATSLASNWNPTTPGAQWTAFRQNIDGGLRALAAAGKMPIVDSFLWAQGETDAQNLTNANAYATNLENFITEVRNTALAQYTVSPNYTVAISGLPAQDIVSIPHQAIVRSAQQTVAAAAANRVYVDTLDLTLNPDAIHFNTQGAINLGRRFSAAIDKRFAGSIAPVK
jgi:hypothetical protein